MNLKIFSTVTVLILTVSFGLLQYRKGSQAYFTKFHSWNAGRRIISWLIVFICQVQNIETHFAKAFAERRLTLWLNAFSANLLEVSLEQYSTSFAPHIPFYRWMQISPLNALRTLTHGMAPGHHSRSVLILVVDSCKEKWPAALLSG